MGALTPTPKSWLRYASRMRQPSWLTAIGLTTALSIGCGDPICERKLTCPQEPGAGGSNGAQGGGGDDVGGAGGAGVGGEAGQGGLGGKPPQSLAATDISMGFEPFTNSDGHACAIAGGDVWCWTNGVAPQKVPGLPFMAQVEVGSLHVCARSAANEVYCWGNNDEGQLGIGTFESTASPTLVTAVPAATEIRLGFYHTCALDNGQAWCWGNDQAGQVGDGIVPQQLNTPYPSLVQNLTSATTLSQGFSNTTCAVRSTGHISCWGNNVFGQSAGTTTSLYQAEGIAGFSSVTSIWTGFYSACARNQGGQLYCIGSDSYGVVDNAGMDAEHPILSSVVEGVEQVAVGHHHACAVLSDNTARCWGRNHKGQLGSGEIVDAPSSNPVVPLDLTGVAEIVTARDATCARTLTGSVYCWGDAPSGVSLTPQLVEIGLR